MRALACGLAMALLCGGCSAEDGRRSQPFFARAVCVVEEWIGRGDYRRRDPATVICDQNGVRIPELTPPQPPNPAPEVPPAD